MGDWTHHGTWSADRLQDLLGYAMKEYGDAGMMVFGLPDGFTLWVPVFDQVSNAWLLFIQKKRSGFDFTVSQ